jgi:hypothetical protein
MNRVASRLWEKMGEIYGEAWPKKYGDTPNQTWSSMCSTTDPKIIGKAIAECIAHNPFPPSLPEFAAYVRDIARQERQIEESIPALPHIMTEQEREHARELVAKVATPKATKGNRRSVLLPGENMADYEKAMAESGDTHAEFRRKRLQANGWALEDELLFLRRLSELNLSHKLGPSDREDFTRE